MRISRLDLVSRTVAELVIASADAHENSFDQLGADKAMAEKVIEDFSEFYTLSIYDACVQEAGDLYQLVFLLLNSSWDGALDWATTEISKPERISTTNLYEIKFADGSSQEEYGKDVADILSFLKRSYSNKGAPVSVTVLR